MGPATGGAVRGRAGYLGPEGTFTEEALLSSALPGAVEPVAMPTIYDTILALRRGELDWALAPIENSLDGSISVTLDLLAGTEMGAKGEYHPAPAGAGMLADPGTGAKRGSPGSGKGERLPAAADEDADIEIVGEALLGVRHSLIAAGEMPLQEIETVLTHPQVPGQCERFLRGELAHARVLAASSTAEAVRTVVADARPGQAALGTTLAAEIYGATVIRQGVQDRDDNETRFVWLARSSEGVPRAGPPLRTAAGGGRADTDYKTSLVFWGAGADSPGWLVRCLNEFGGRSINLTKIESRPKRERMGSYMFFVDLQGQADSEPVAAAILGLRAICEQARVLGSYRSAVPPRSAGAPPSSPAPPSPGEDERDRTESPGMPPDGGPGEQDPGNRRRSTAPPLHSGSADG